MRKRFEQQNRLDAIPIPDVAIDSKSRHELPELLAGLQYIFITPELNEAVFEILESKILGGKKATGRLGMSLWEVLVLGSVRLNLDVDYDMLHDLSNNHDTLRGILGVQNRQVFWEERKVYNLQTLKDNVRLLDEQALSEISEIVVKAGHKLKKNEGKEDRPIALQIKADTYVVESNIHFPTDLDLLWDSARKSLAIVSQLLSLCFLASWRKHKVWMKKVKRQYLKCANIHQKKGRNYQARLNKATKEYLKVCRKVSTHIEQSMDIWGEAAKSDIKVSVLLDSLNEYHQMLEKHIDLVERRILKGEKIPHGEKVFSIFEPEVEWIQKGKHGKSVELGHNVLVATDQFHFIVDHQTVVGQTDKALVIPLVERLEEKYGDKDIYELDSLSFDRGFCSKLAKEAAQKKFSKVIMPKPGKKSAKQEMEESEDIFVELRNKHSAVESNINELEHSGLNKVPDKGLEGFKKYVAWGVLAYNLRRLGKIVIKQKLIPTAAKEDWKLKLAA